MHFPVESVERWVVVRPAIVGVMPTQNGGEPLVLRGASGACMSRQPSLRNAVNLRGRRFPFVLCFTMNRPFRVRPQ